MLNQCAVCLSHSFTDYPMNLNRTQWFLVGLCALLTCSPSLAQTPPRVLKHKSTFDNYRPYSDEKAANWKAANDEVGRIGGWRAYLKEAQEPDPVKDNKPAGSAPTKQETQPSPQTTPQKLPTPAPPVKTAEPVNPHAGHGSKK
jgi:hypothetical protein